MLKAIAIDDEPIALEVIKNLAGHVVFIELEACFTNSFKAMEHLQHHKTDLVFLVIKMQNISAIDYLLKPFSLPRFLKACNKAHEQYELRKNHGISAAGQSIFIKSGYEQVR